MAKLYVWLTKYPQLYSSKFCFPSPPLPHSCLAIEGSADAISLSAIENRIDPELRKTGMWSYRTGLWCHRYGYFGYFGICMKMLRHNFKWCVLRKYFIKAYRGTDSSILLTQTQERCTKRYTIKKNAEPIPILKETYTCYLHLKLHRPIY